MQEYPSVEKQASPLNTASASATTDWRINLRHPHQYLGERDSSWWTGKPPFYFVCPGVDQHGIIRSLPLLNLKDYSRATLQDYFDNTWTLTETLFSALQSEEAFYRPPYHHIRHPLIFYYAHPAVLYVNKLKLAGIISTSVNEYFEKLFETGVDEMSWDDLSKNQIEWPTIAAITAYRAQVYQLVRDVIRTHPDLNGAPITQQHSVWALIMGFEHERIHLETSSVLIRELPIHLVRKPAQWPAYFTLQMQTAAQPILEKDYPRNELISYAQATVTLGKPAAWPSYGWDNEYGERRTTVNAFRASQFLISNGEFYEFVASGGYTDAKYWSEEGWAWCQYRQSKQPSFWVTDNGEFKLRLCFDDVPMQWSWPVDINYHEAKAYCAWRTEKDRQLKPYRLSTEAEQHVLREIQHDDLVMLYSGHAMQLRKYNFNLAYGSQTPVNFSTPTKAGCYDTFGNVWEWCEDTFNPLPGFAPQHLYADFSTPCFDGKHQMIMGSSFISTGAEASRFARFHFRPHFFQHASFRILHDI